MQHAQSQRVILRDWITADLDPFTYWMQPHHHWHTLDGPYYPTPSGEETQALIEQVRAQMALGQWPEPRTRLIIAERVTNQLLGHVSRYWESIETNWLCVGIVLYDPRTWGQGLGYEALGLWCEYLWRAFPDLVRLDLRTWSGNVGITRLARKLGFQEEARFRKARIVNGRYYDGLGYGVLREEWEQRYPQGFVAQLR